MKLLIMALLFAVTLKAQADDRPDYYVLDLTAENFESQQVNLLGDEMWDYNGFAIRLDGVDGEDFEVVTKVTNPESFCDYELISERHPFTVLKIDENMETDSGDACYITITKRNGKKAKIMIYSEGT